MLTRDNKSIANDFNVEQTENGKWKVIPKEKPDYVRFQSISKVMRAHGGVLLKGAVFLFKDEPTWLATATLEEPTPKAMPEKKVVTQPTAKAPIKPVKAVSPKKATKTEKTSESKGVEFEIYQPESVEVCITHLGNILGTHSNPEDDPSHPMLIKMLRDACLEDEELRANLTHKDYDKVLEDAAFAWYQDVQKEKPRGGACSPATILPYVLKEYKKPVVKKIESTSDKSSNKKSTSKKGNK